MLRLREDSWIIKTYRFSERMKSNFHGWSRWKVDDKVEGDLTNLCYMVRSIVLYLPFMVLMHVAALIAVLEAAFIYPMSKVGLRWFLVPAWILGVVVCIVAIICIGGFSWEYFRDKRKKKPVVMKPQSDGWRTMKAYMDARHRDICPYIEIVRPGHENDPPIVGVPVVPIANDAYECDCEHCKPLQTNPDDPENQS